LELLSGSRQNLTWAEAQGGALAYDEPAGQACASRVDAKCDENTRENTRENTSSADTQLHKIAMLGRTRLVRAENRRLISNRSSSFGLDSVVS
jgi:hypothetical protein